MKNKTISGELTSAQKKLVVSLFDIGAIKFGDFKLKLHDLHPEAPLSPIYIDLRVIQRFPKTKKLALFQYENLLKKLKFDILAGIPVAGTPITSSLSDRLQIGMITPRVDSKKHGTGSKIDGLSKTDKGKTAVLIDDLITGADSKFEAIEVLKKEGLKIKDVVVLIDREQGGSKELKKRGYVLHSTIKLSQILDFYLRSKKISAKDYEDIKKRLDQLNLFLKS